MNEEGPVLALLFFLERELREKVNNYNLIIYYVNSFLGRFFKHFSVICQRKRTWLQQFDTTSSRPHDCRGCVTTPDLNIRLLHPLDSLRPATCTAECDMNKLENLSTDKKCLQFDSYCCFMVLNYLVLIIDI